MDQCSKSWRHCREEYPRYRKSLRSSFSPRTVPSRLGTFPKLGKKEYRRAKNFKASVERSERVERRRKAAIEQPEQEATKKRKLLEQSGHFTVLWKNPLTWLYIIWKNEMEKADDYFSASLLQSLSPQHLLERMLKIL